MGKKGITALPDIAEGEVFRVMDQGRWKEAKLCLICKKEFTWRKKWERNWGEITTCSEKCKQERKRRLKSG